MTVHFPAQQKASDGLVRRSFDADDVRRMVEAGILEEDERVELVEGELLAMASKGFAHERVKNLVARLASRALDTDVYVAVESTLRLSRATLLEPDILIAREDAVMRSPEGFVTYREGGILLAIEVAASSLAYDRGRKAGLYARYGVSEYWVIDANERCAWVHTEPGEDGYTAIDVVARGGVLKPRAPELAALAVDLAALA